MNKMNSIKGMLIKAGIVISLVIGDGLYKNLQGQTISQDGSVLERYGEITHLDKEFNGLITRNTSNPHKNTLTTFRNQKRKHPMRNAAYGILAGSILSDEELSDRQKIAILIGILGDNKELSEDLKETIVSSENAVFVLKQTKRTLNACIKTQEEKIALEQNKIVLENTRKINQHLDDVIASLESFKKMFDSKKK